MYEAKIYDGGGQFIRKIDQKSFIFNSVEEGFNGETSAEFGVRTLLTQKNGDSGLNEDLNYLDRYNKVEIFYIEDNSSVLFYEGFISGVSRGFDVFTCSCVGIHDYCLKKVLLDPVNTTENASIIANSEWAKILELFDSGVKISSSVADPIEFDLKAGAKFSQLLDAILDQGNELAYSNRNIVIAPSIGKEIPTILKFSFSSLRQNNVRAPESIDIDFSQSADAVYYRNSNAGVFINNGANNDLIMETQDSESGDLSEKGNDYLELYSEGYTDYEVSLDPSKWKPGDIRPGDIVNTDIDLGITGMSLQGKTRVQSVNIAGEGTGYEIKLQLSNEPKNDLSIRDITKRIKRLEDLLS